MYKTSNVDIRENNTEVSIYGKTGMGKARGIVVELHGSQVAETLEGNKYFCVYLGQSDAGNTSSTATQNRHSNS